MACNSSGGEELQHSSSRQQVDGAAVALGSLHTSTTAQGHTACAACVAVHGCPCTQMRDLCNPCVCFFCLNSCRLLVFLFLWCHCWVIIKSNAIYCGPTLSHFSVAQQDFVPHLCLTSLCCVRDPCAAAGRGPTVAAAPAGISPLAGTMPTPVAAVTVASSEEGWAKFD